MADFVVWLASTLVIFSIIFFIFGCIVGSFLNVVIHRLPREMSVANPPSHCPQCNYTIPWYQNIPLITWAWQRGKCAGCELRISIRYFLVELLTGLSFLGGWLLVYYHFASGNDPFITQPIFAAIVTLAIVTLLGGLIASTFIDLEHFIIPDELTKGGMVVGVIFSVLAPQLHGAFLGEQISRGSALVYSLLGMACGGAIIYAVVRMGKALFGKQTFNSNKPVKVTFATHAMHMAAEEDEEDLELLYEEIFYRSGDTITLHAEHVELIDRCLWNQDIAITAEAAKIGTKEFKPGDIPHMEVTTTEVVVPREAMGFGDVKFMAAIGAFLGWQATVFSLMFSAVLGAIVGTLIMATRKDNANIIPYGPYIALAAVIWIFGGYQLWDWWWGGLKP
tara:strand:+ start:728 stop:1903 length:1176 start_codon:yes stop_codon:yes gene_type:complete